MQFVYMCRNGENEELRYSIRSVLHFFPDAEIWLIGGKPSWYTGNHIMVKQDLPKYANVRNNIAALLQSDQINDSFVYMNDDFYLTSFADFETHYHRGYLDTYLDQNRECCRQYVYVKLIGRAYSKIKKIVKDRPLNYELHIPIKISKSALEKSSKNSDMWRSFYGNYYKIGGVETQDCKFYEWNVENTDLLEFVEARSPFLSSNDKSFEFLLNSYLLKKFPTKSKHEI
jgi:hypothetical protein